MKCPVMARHCGMLGKALVTEFYACPHQDFILNIQVTALGLLFNCPRATMALLRSL